MPAINFRACNAHLIACLIKTHLIQSSDPEGNRKRRPWLLYRSRRCCLWFTFGRKSHHLSRQPATAQQPGDPLGHLNAISLNACVWVFASISSSRIDWWRHGRLRHPLLELTSSRLEPQSEKKKQPCSSWVNKDPSRSFIFICSLHRLHLSQVRTISPLVITLCTSGCTSFHWS